MKLFVFERQYSSWSKCWNYTVAANDKLSAVITLMNEYEMVHENITEDDAKEIEGIEVNCLTERVISGTFWYQE